MVRKMQRFLVFVCVIGLSALLTTGRGEAKKSSVLGYIPAVLASPCLHPANGVVHGWYVRDDHVVWGYAQHNGWWRAGQRANLTRNAPGVFGPNRTEILPSLAENMLRWGYPGFEHNFGLWYDRRRDRHDTKCRNNGNVESPFLEQPWARSHTGRACDGRSLYDLTSFNAWYFARLYNFAKIAEQQGLVFFNNFYMQHALLEMQAHYVDFPWRPGNAIQSMGLPAKIPAANSFYDVSDPQRRKLHKKYIFHVLDVLADFPQIVHLISEEYTGPLAFMEFWLDTVDQWQKNTGHRLHIGLGATKDVLDAILSDPVRSKLVSTIDLRYWWYTADGSLQAPAGGHQISGRYAAGFASSATTPEQIYRQVKQYRLAYPEKAIIHTIDASRKQTWAFLMAGGSMLIRRMEYPNGEDPSSYIQPEDSPKIMPLYTFINTYLSNVLQEMKPDPVVLDHPGVTWCLDDGGERYLIYALHGGDFRVNLGSGESHFHEYLVNPRSGLVADLGGIVPPENGIVSFSMPDDDDWAVLLTSY